MVHYSKSLYIISHEMKCSGLIKIKHGFFFSSPKQSLSWYSIVSGLSIECESLKDENIVTHIKFVSFH